MSTIVEKVSDAVNDVTAALGNTSISDKPVDATTTGDKDKSATNDAVLASAAEGRRLYIGNLAYATTEGELQAFFKGYLIESTSIPKNPRTDRPVGYAFVDLSTPSEAERAITELSGKEILERKVSVQLARKPEPNAEKGEGATSGGEGASGGEGRRRQSGRGRGRGRGRGGRGGRNRGASRGEEGAELPAGDVLPLTETTNTETKDKEVKDTKEKAEKAPRVPRERRERGPPADGIPSKNKVMVANLPYDLSEEKLKELFAAYEPSSAKIALRPIPRFMVKKLQARNEPRKGRGFGFVTLASEEMQQKAVAEMNAKEIEGREIAVKVAIDSPDKTDDDVNAPAAEAATEGTNGAAETTTAA
ncbi:RNA-binding domain-containing protein [Cadophora sp. DSE1049]|nr:RNA-binding domain-containing protein [Cadophora sp. DSE1049]